MMPSGQMFLAAALALASTATPGDEKVVAPRGEYAGQYLERDAIRLVGDAEQEVYRLRRSAPPAPAGAPRR
jgi:hypothetical protein